MVLRLTGKQESTEDDEDKDVSEILESTLLSLTRFEVDLVIRMKCHCWRQHSQADDDKEAEIMQVQEKKIGQNLVVKPFDRRIDASVAVQFKGLLVSFINAGNSTIILDLSNVEFIDSSGLGAIVSSLKAIGPAGDLVICGPRDAVMSLFRLTRMNRVFQIFDTADEALNALSK